MRLIKSGFLQLFPKVLFVAVLVCLLSLSWVSFAQSSYAAETTTAQPSANAEVREESYEEAKEIADDPKFGIEKEYEQEIEAYREENGEGGIVEGAKDLVTKVTGN